MNTTITISEAGRIVIPKIMRDELHVGRGDLLEVACNGKEITLRPVQAVPRMRKKRGIWVFNSGSGRLTTLEDFNRIRNEIYEERERRFLNPEK